MTRRAIARLTGRLLFLVVVAFGVILLLGLGHRAHRPVNPPLSQAEATNERSFEGMERGRGEYQDLVILAFSGGGTRAAAFAYGVLETLRDIEVSSSSGRKTTLLDEVDVIS